MPTLAPATHSVASAPVAPFSERLATLRERRQELLDARNRPVYWNGVIERHQNAVVTAAHVPLEWRYDLDERTNPWLLERIGVNSTFNAGAIAWGDSIVLCIRVEGVDRKSYFALAESKTGVDRFRFRDHPLELPDIDPHEVNVYDMRLVAHEDGWVYGTFCSEKRDLTKPADLSAATAGCGIVRTRDLESWERLPNLKTGSPQQRNCVLHPEFVEGKYLFYTRPLSSFVTSTDDAGVSWGLCDSIERPSIDQEHTLDRRSYHAIDEAKSGQGPSPIKTPEGWLHLAHGVRNTAAGLRYVLYVFLTSLDDPRRIIKRPAGYLLAPEESERVGDVSNVVFSNGWVARDNGTVLIYYGASDTRVHVASTSIERLLDYVRNSPIDGGRSHASVGQVMALIRRNASLRAEGVAR
jgi:4-O-beta-D-mannosyl-D-glucose phosphorylase